MIRIIIIFFACLFSGFTLLADADRIQELEKKLSIAKDTARVNVLNKLTRAYELSDTQKANAFADSALNLGQEINYSDGIIKSYMNKSLLRQFEGKTDEGIDFLNKAILLSEETDNDALLSQCYSRLGGMHFTRGEINEAETYAKLSLDIANELDSMTLKIASYELFGIIYGTSGEYQKALEYFFLILEYHTKNGNERNMAVFYKQIGQTYRLIEKYDDAIKYLNSAYEIQHRLHNNQQEAWILSNIGTCYSNKGEDDVAIPYYRQSLELAQQHGYPQLVIINLNLIGIYYMSKSDLDEAEKYLHEAYTASENYGKNSHAIYILESLARIYLDTDRISESIEFGTKQLALAKEEKIIAQIQSATGLLADVYAKKGDYENAYKFQEELLIVNDSIYNLEKSKQIEEITTKYETKKKEQEIDNLKAINEVARYRNFSYAGAAISFFILGGLLYYVQRSRIKRNHQLLEKEKELDRMKSRFFANISHEFRSPLTLLLGPIEEMFSKAKEPDDRKKLKIMKKNTGRMLDLINQLLDLSKIESGKLKLSTTFSDIITVIKGVSMSFHSMADQKDIELELNIEPDHLEMNYDRPKVETILTNLLSNAFKFTQEGGKITIQSRILDKDQSQLRRQALNIEVIDNGIGIPDEDIDQVFNRFYQSDTNQLLQQEGSGIGLALTRELVELHEGKITATSIVGKGTRFSMELPTELPSSYSGPSTQQLKPVNKPEELMEEYEEEVDSEIVEKSQKPMVLLIEDHDDVRQYVEETLQNSFHVVCTKNGEEGINRALETVPDLIISDVMMPKKDGYEVCHRLKNDEKTSHIPVILLTAKSDSSDKITGLRTRADDYVTKPFVPKELLARIDNLIESRKRLREKYHKEGTLRPKDVAVNSIDEQFLNRLVGIVEHHMGNEQFGVEQLGDELNMNRTQLYRKLKALVNQGPNQFIRTFRLQRAHDLLKQKSATAAEIAYQVGFSSPSYFAKCFHDEFGYSPSQVSE